LSAKSWNYRRKFAKGNEMKFGEYGFDVWHFNTMHILSVGVQWVEKPLWSCPFKVLA